MLAYLNKAYLAGHMYLSKHSVYAKKHDATYSKAGDFMFHFREYKAPFLEGADRSCFCLLTVATMSHIASIIPLYKQIDMREMLVLFPLLKLSFVFNSKASLGSYD